jgi:hypothetical protein
MGNFRRLSSRRCFGHQRDSNAPAPGTSSRGAVFRDGPRVAIALDRELRDRDTRGLDQPVPYRFGTRPGKREVAGRIARIVGISGDQNLLAGVRTDQLERTDHRAVCPAAPKCDVLDIFRHADLAQPRHLLDEFGCGHRRTERQVPVGLRYESRISTTDDGMIASSSSWITDSSFPNTPSTHTWLYAGISENCVPV